MQWCFSQLSDIEVKGVTLKREKQANWPEKVYKGAQWGVLGSKLRGKIACLQMSLKIHEMQNRYLCDHIKLYFMEFGQ